MQKLHYKARGSKQGGCNPREAAHTIHFNRCDIVVDDPRKPTVPRVTIKQSKTNPFQRGIDLFLGKTAIDLCPVKAMLN